MNKKINTKLISPHPVQNVLILTSRNKLNASSLSPTLQPIKPYEENLTRLKD